MQVTIQILVHGKAGLQGPVASSQVYKHGEQMVNTLTCAHALELTGEVYWQMNKNRRHLILSCSESAWVWVTN